MPLSAYPIAENYPKIGKTGLRDGLTDSVYMKVITTPAEEVLAHNPECTQCEYRNICRGGCRASALAMTPEDIFGKDEMACLFFKGGYKKKIEQAAASAGFLSASPDG